MATKLGLYFPKNPAGLFKFLKENPEGEYFLFVDNDDHKVSSEFYELRKLIRKGSKVKVFVNPSVGSGKEVHEFLTKQVPDLNGLCFGEEEKK